MNRLLSRVNAIMLAPEAEWEVVAREPNDAVALFTRYVAVLALIPALAGFVASSLIGRYTSLLSGLLAAVISYVAAFIGVVVMALIVDGFAPRFGAQKNFGNALKLTVYCHTPYWLAGVFLIIPGLSFLTILGLYGTYLMWLGLPPVMQVPREKSLPYTLVVVACAIVLVLAQALLHALSLDRGP